VSDVNTEYKRVESLMSCEAGRVAVGLSCLLCQGETSKAIWPGRLWSLILGINATLNTVDLILPVSTLATS
jgi:hypothetical protein